MQTGFEPHFFLRPAEREPAFANDTTECFFGLETFVDFGWHTIITPVRTLQIDILKIANNHNIHYS